MASQFLTSSMMSRDSMTSYSWRPNIQSRRIRKLGPGLTIRAELLIAH